MKQLLILLFLIVSSVHASQHDVERQIYQNIFHAIFPEKSTIYIWSDDKDKVQLFQGIMKVIIVDSINKADLLVICQKLNIKSNILKFACSYTTLKHYKKSVIGGFYWQKGRPNLILLRPGLKHWGMRVSGELKEVVRERP